MSRKLFYAELVDEAESRIAGQVQPSVELLSAAIAGEWFVSAGRDRSPAYDAFFELVELGSDVFDAAWEDSA